MTPEKLAELKRLLADIEGLAEQYLGQIATKDAAAQRAGIRYKATAPAPTRALTLDQLMDGVSQHLTKTGGHSL